MICLIIHQSLITLLKHFQQIAVRLKRYDDELKMLCCRHQPLYPSNSSAIQEDDDYDDEDLILCCEQENGMYYMLDVFITFY